MTDKELIHKKYQRSIESKKLRTIDLFAGCGGMSLGFDRQGFKSMAAIELDPAARKSHELNFGRHRQYKSFSDITKVKPAEAVAHLEGLDKEKIDVVIGGPPCQAFSRLGRARLWQLAGQKGAHVEDDRATMYQYYLEYVSSLKPMAFVMENVREIGKFCGRNIAEEISQYADSLGYNVRYTLLNAAWYGVPQLRERAFIIGIHKSLNVVPSFPKITHDFNIPTGYSTSKLGRSGMQFLDPKAHFIDNYANRKIRRATTTLGEAFADLPPIYTHLLEKTSTRKPQNTQLEMEYLRNSSSEFTKLMRNWPRFKNGAHTFTGHIIRKTPRDYSTFRHMPEGGMYPDAVKTAVQIFHQEIQKIEQEKNIKVKPNSKLWKEVYASIVPPYPIDKYPNKFRKLWKDQPSRTLPAHIGKDSYSHIHFDSEQARGISLREAARIQSFPDGFKFHGSMNAQLKQIGNAVPPLLAFAIAKKLKTTLFK